MNGITAKALFKNLRVKVPNQWYYLEACKGFNGINNPWDDFNNPEDWEQITQWLLGSTIKDTEGNFIFQGDTLEEYGEVIYEDGCFKAFINGIGTTPLFMFDQNELRLTGNTYE